MSGEYDALDKALDKACSREKHVGGYVHPGTKHTAYVLIITSCDPFLREGAPHESCRTVPGTLLPRVTLMHLLAFRSTGWENRT